MEPITRPKEYELPGDIKLDRQIGKGSFGIVFIGTYEDSKEPVAIKVINKNIIPYNILVIKIKRELIPKTILKCQNKNIICVRDLYENETSFYIISNYIPGLSLSKYNLRNKLIGINIFYQLVTGLIFMHANNVYHRDIKPQNIIITVNGNVPIYIDFDSSCVKNGKILECIGRPRTPNYQAPELWDKESKIDWEKADIYSLGATMFYLFNDRQTPYENRYSKDASKDQQNKETIDNLKFDIYTQQLPPRPSNSGENIIDNLVNIMLSRDPNKRIPLLKIKKELEESFILVP